MLVYRGYTDDSYIGTLTYMIYQRSCTDDTHIVYLHARGYMYHVLGYTVCNGGIIQED